MGMQSMIAPYSHTIVLLCVLLICIGFLRTSHARRVAIGSVNSFHSEAVSDFSAQLSDKSIALLSFGFKHNKASQNLVKSLYDAVKGSEDSSVTGVTGDASCLVIDEANPQYLRQIGTASVVVGFLPKILLVSDPTSLLNHIQAYIDGIFYGKTGPIGSSSGPSTNSLILVVEEGDIDIEPFKKVVDLMLEDASHPEKSKIEVG